MKKLLILVLICSSCAPVYVPNVRNSPLFNKGGEFQAAVQVGNGFDIQAAGSITNNIALIANYSLGEEVEVESASGSEQKLRKFYEAGAGYYNTRGFRAFELFAGYGRGETSGISSIFQSTPLAIYGKYERFFVQPAYGIRKEDFHLSFVPRLSYVKFTSYYNDGVTYSQAEDPVLFFEPAVVAKINFADNMAFFTAQAGIAAPVTSDVNFDYRNFQTSIGLGFRLTKREKN